MGFTDRFARSWDMATDTCRMLASDRVLIVFPLLSGFFWCLIAANFAAPAVKASWWHHLVIARYRGSGLQMEPREFGMILLFYLLTHFCVAFFNVALVACVRQRFAGQCPTVLYGLNYAAANLGLILQWTLLSATVGSVLRVLDGSGRGGRMVSSIVGFAWTSVCAFAIPVLVYEQLPPFAAVRRAIHVLKHTWGEAIIANVGVAIAIGLLYWLAPVIVLMGTYCAMGIAGSNLLLFERLVACSVLLAAAYLALLSIVRSALDGIFITACYEYAVTGRVPGDFAPIHITDAWGSPARPIWSS